MSDPIPYTFTDQQMVDIRRFCGYYPLTLTTNSIFLNVLVNQAGVLEYRCQNLSPEEGQTVVNVYLANLATLEQAILTAAGNLDTNRVAVVERNPTEIRDRTALFEDWRLRLCEFLGVEPGPSVRRRRGGSFVV